MFSSDKPFRLFQGDMLEVLDRQVADHSVDMIFADPPYNLSNDGFTCSGGRMVSVNKGEWDRSKGVEADFLFHQTWIAACRRKLKPGGTLWVSGTYHSIYQCGYALQVEGMHILNDISWFKPNASPNLSCRMFTASHETLIWARTAKKSKHHFDYEAMKHGSWEEDPLKKPDKQMRSVWSIPLTKRVEKRFGKHPTQKPEALLERVVLASTRPGDVVLDPFCGSGTTGVAALRFGRRFIGIDMDVEFLEGIARPRLEDAAREPLQLDLRLPEVVGEARETKRRKAAARTEKAAAMEAEIAAILAEGRRAAD